MVAGRRSRVHTHAYPVSLGVRRRYLVSYDISDDKRRTAVFDAMHGFGDWAQFSIFFCELTPAELARMRGVLRARIDQVEDQILILDLGRARTPLEANLEVLGRGYEPVVRSFIV